MNYFTTINTMSLTSVVIVKKKTEVMDKRAYAVVTKDIRCYPESMRRIQPYAHTISLSLTLYAMTNEI